MRYCCLFLLVLLTVGCGKSAPVADYPVRAKAANQKVMDFLGKAGEDADLAPLLESQREFQALVADYRQSAVARRPSFKHIQMLAVSLGYLKTAAEKQDGLTEAQTEEAAFVPDRLEQLRADLEKEENQKP